jgi:ferrous iron transport protein A
MRTMNITQLKIGKSARIIEIQGGLSVQQKFLDIGIVPGKTVKKTNDTILHGPVVLSVGPAQVAIGFGMARKILIEELDAI